MRIGILISSIGNFGQKGYYNAQEVGLARELDKVSREVIIFKMVSSCQTERIEQIDGCRNTILRLIPVKNLGINGLVDTELLDESLDALVYFSDTQLMVSRVAKWAKKHNVLLCPYIGVMESHSTNPMKRLLIDTLARRNLAVYRKLHCFAKTTAVEKQLQMMGVSQTTVAPVGLDLSLMHQNFMQASPEELKKQYGYQAGERVLLFIGRFTAEKQPEQMVMLFKSVYDQNEAYRLLMIGTGELRESTENLAKKLGLADKIQFVDCIPNSDIWKVYCFADAFVNLNQQEIFGMAILEAMYYGCTVIANHAPGPDEIIEDGVSGYLVDSTAQMTDMILEGKRLSADVVRNYLLSRFTWEQTAETMHRWIQQKIRSV